MVKSYSRSPALVQLLCPKYFINFWDKHPKTNDILHIFRYVCFLYCHYQSKHESLISCISCFVTKSKKMEFRKLKRGSCSRIYHDYPPEFFASPFKAPSFYRKRGLPPPFKDDIPQLGEDTKLLLDE